VITLYRNEILFNAVKHVFQTIQSYTYQKRVKVNPTAFTRERKMGLVKIIAFILNFTRKSLQLELDEFFELMKSETGNITKQAFSKARQKLSPEAFIIIFQEVVKLFYTAIDLKTYRGYRLLAIDGSTLELQNTEELRTAFGYAENATSKYARARVSGLYDVENKIMIDVRIARYDCSEKELAYQHIQRLQEYGLQNDLILFDRGYPSKELIAMLYKANINFVMRVTNYFINEVRCAKGSDQIVEFQYKGKKYPLRVVRFMLESGEEEILVSSLMEPSFSLDDFKELYFKRWGIETKYDELKHKLQIENFTGEKPIAVEQDFYATMYLSNMAALAKINADEAIQARNEDKELLYEYQANTNLLIGKLKDNLIVMMLEPNDRKRRTLFKQIMKKITRNAVPIRPGRRNPRIRRLTRDRYPMNQKRCL
jgi:hypothetical protein